MVPRRSAIDVSCARTRQAVTRRLDGVCEGSQLRTMTRMKLSTVGAVYISLRRGGAARTGNERRGQPQLHLQRVKLRHDVSRVGSHRGGCGGPSGAMAALLRTVPLLLHRARSNTRCVGDRSCSDNKQVMGSGSTAWSHAHSLQAEGCVVLSGHEELRMPAALLQTTKLRPHLAAT